MIKSNINILNSLFNKFDHNHDDVNYHIKIAFQNKKKNDSILIDCLQSIHWSLKRLKLFFLNYLHSSNKMLRPNIVRQLTRIGFLNTINKQMICGSKRLYQDNHQQTYDESEFSHKNDDDNIEQLPMYDGHILLSPIQRTLLSVGSALAALNDPYRDGNSNDKR